MAGLPDANKDISNLVSKLDGRPGIGQIIGDRDANNIVYVRPTSKTFTGDFAQVGGSVSCHELHENRIATFRYPNETEIPRVISNSMPYSPAFEANFGVAARNSKITNDIQEIRSDILKYTREHKDIYGTYQKAKALYEGKKARLDVIESKDRTLDSKLNSQLAMAMSQDERTLIIAEYRQSKRDLAHDLAFLSMEVDNAHLEYAEALEDWAPYKDELEWLEKAEDSLVRSYDRLQRISIESLRRSKELIDVLETRPIGYATASYSFNANSEIENLRSAINELNLPAYNVLALPVFDVRLNTGINISMNGRVDNFNYQYETYNFPSQLDLSHPDAREKTFNYPNTKLSDQNGEGNILVNYPDMEGSFGGARAFKFPVTLGAFCGYPKSKKVTYSFTNDEGYVHQEDVMQTVYESPAPEQAIFAQHVGLRYKFFEAAAPIKGKCRMDIKQASNYHRSRGSKSSWRWFKKVTHRWDDTTHNLANEMGIKCEITEAPSSIKEEDMKQASDELKNMLYQDMYSMFIMTYAKDYDLEVAVPTHAEGKPQVFGNLGNGIMNICGHNKGCQIANVVLKSLDDLVGVRHSGSTSSRITSTGVLQREMSLNTFIVNEGAANFEMRVCIDKEKCQ